MELAGYGVLCLNDVDAVRILSEEFFADILVTILYLRHLEGI